MDKIIGVQQYLHRKDEIEIRLREIADALEAEKRSLNDSEKVEVEALEREKQALCLRISSADQNGKVKISSREIEFDNYLRNVLASKIADKQVLKRESIVTTDVSAIIPLTLNQLIEPLEEGLIYDKVGLPILTGLAGSYVWPVVSNAVEAAIASENVALNDSDIDFTAVTPVPKRVGITIKLTAQTITQTEGVAYQVVLNQIPKSVARLLNKVLFTTDQNSNYGFESPFKAIAGETSYTAAQVLSDVTVMKAAKHITIASSIPTFTEVMALKGCVLAKGIAAENLAFVMDEYTKAVLETTPVDAGSGRFIVENGKIAGLPVFCTNYINSPGKTYIGFGNFGYLPLQQFGDTRFVVDPYSEATKDVVRVTLNADWASSVLREEAFALLEVKGDSLAATAISIPETLTVTAAAGANHTKKLAATLTPSNSNSAVTWTSSAPGKATVDDKGNVTGVASGSATITATCNGLTDTCTVTVS